MGGRTYEGSKTPRQRVASDPLLPRIAEQKRPGVRAVDHVERVGDEVICPARPAAGLTDADQVVLQGTTGGQTITLSAGTASADGRTVTLASIEKVEVKHLGGSALASKVNLLIVSGAMDALFPSGTLVAEMLQEYARTMEDVDALAELRAKKK